MAVVVDELTRYRGIYGLLCQEDGSAKTSKVFEYIRSHVPDEKMMAVIEAVKGIDANGDGTLSFMEFKRGFPKVEAVLGKTIDLTPLESPRTRGVPSANLITTEQLLAIQKYFHDIDTDKSGTIDPSEMKTGLETLSPDQAIYGLIQTSLDYMDVDQDGLVSFGEFLKAVRKGAESIHSASEAAKVEKPVHVPLLRPRSGSSTESLSTQTKSIDVPYPQESFMVENAEKPETLEDESEKLRAVIKERDAELRNLQRQLDIKDNQLREEVKKRDVIQMEMEMIRLDRQYDKSNWERQVEELQVEVAAKHAEIYLEQERAQSAEKVLDGLTSLLTEENQELTQLLTREKERNNELINLYETAVLDLKNLEEATCATKMELEEKVAELVDTIEDTKHNILPIRSIDLFRSSTFWRLATGF